jgi:DNA polymerase III subunit delta
MVAVPPRDAEAFLKNGFSQFPVILIYGPDEGLVSERAASIARATTSGDAGNILRLDGDDIAADPMRLADEANAISMFGGMRAIRVRMGSKSIVPGLEPLLSSPPVDARIIVEAGDIKPNHALRALLEKGKDVAALACYGEDSRDIGRLLDTLLQESGQTISNDARQALTGLLGQDHKRSRLEIEKVILYTRGASQITRDDIDAVMTDAAALSADAVIDATFLGKLDGIETEARRVLADGLEAGVLLGFALRHAFLLQSIKRNSGNNQNVGESIKSARVSWKREKAVAEQINRWTETRLERAVQILGDAVLAIRRNAALSDALAIRALWSLALSVQRR